MKVVENIFRVAVGKGVERKLMKIVNVALSSSSCGFFFKNESVKYDEMSRIELFNSIKYIVEL